jgi:hypothetical protein
MYRYREIEDAAELKQLSDQLTKRIQKQLKFPMTKVVGYPSGHAEVQVNFGSRRGQDVPWWSSQLSENGDAYINLIGRGDPESNAFLMIVLQFNVPVKEFGRRHGGAFVQDIESGATVLAHRGIVTRGMSRVRKDALLQETTATITLVETSQGATPLLLVASLDSPQLVEDITDFAEEIRRAADAVKTYEAEEAAIEAKSGARTLSQSIDGHLGSYFDEFCGKRKLPRREAVIVEVRHGRVVQRLRTKLEDAGTALKSQYVDLAIRKRDTVLLFEVKTSVSPTDFYTAIGQLYLHSLVVKEQFPRVKVRKILVIPESPNPHLRKRMEKGLGIELLTFHWKGDVDIEFDKTTLGALHL